MDKVAIFGAGDIGKQVLLNLEMSWLNFLLIRLKKIMSKVFWLYHMKSS